MGTDNSPDKQVKSRNESGQWVPGVSGNPNGRPPKGYSITETIKEMIDAQPDIKKALGAVIIEKAVKEKDMAAIKLVWSYMDGMPLQKQEIDNKDNAPMRIILENTNEKREDISGDS